MPQQTSRRSFLLGAGGASLAPAVAASLGGSAPLWASVPPGREDYWDMVRRQFSFHESRVPMNAANLCPSPRAVADQVKALLARA